MLIASVNTMTFLANTSKHPLSSLPHFLQLLNFIFHLTISWPITRRQHVIKVTGHAKVSPGPNEELQGTFLILDFLRGKGMLSAVIYPVNSEPTEPHI